MIVGEKTANAVGGRTARACESCLRRRARWYCAADDAFLCGGCDASVHSANQLARRHERVRLEMAGPPPLPSGNKPKIGRLVSPPNSSDDSVKVPAWHGGFTRKARTPRKKSPGADGGATSKLPSPGELVPELSSEFDASTGSIDENDDGFQCLVPVFDSFGADDDCDFMGIVDGGTCDELDFGLLLPSEVDLEEFAADVESLLGKAGMDEDIGGEVKVKDELLGEDIMMELGDDETAAGRNFEMAGAWEVVGEAEAMVDWDLEFRSSGEDVEDEKPAVVMAASDQKNNLGDGDDEEKKRTKMLLRLNYEDIITAWSSHGSPWTSGTRPDFRPDDGWPECMGSYASDVNNPHSYGDLMGLRVGHLLGGDDKGREARVSRYREKRRTRMFSKKIRYQVRKLNAEKRPRMKGRFVKRT